MGHICSVLMPPRGIPMHVPGTGVPLPGNSVCYTASIRLMIMMVVHNNNEELRKGWSRELKLVDSEQPFVP
eukprot:1183156-Rhodomonas_salina.1